MFLFCVLVVFRRFDKKILFMVMSLMMILRMFLCSLFPGLFVFRRIDYRQSHMYGAPQSLHSPFITGKTFDDAI